MKTTKAISILTAGLVFCLALGSFALSYSNLMLLAGESGIRGWLAYIWPLLIDASLIVFSLSVVNAYLHGEGTWRQWSLVGLYTVATIGFNILHAPDNLQAQIVAAIAPISLFFSFELLMSQLKASVKRYSTVKSIDELQKELNAKRKESSKLDDNLTAKHEEFDNLVAQIYRQKLALNVSNNPIFDTENDNLLDARQQAKNERVNTLLAFLGDNPEATLTEASDFVGVSRQTISNYVNELTEANLLIKNGNGWEVAQ